MTITVASGKGGTGKTLVSTSMFYAALKWGIPVALADCDTEEPNAGQFVTGGLIQSFPVTQDVPEIRTDLCRFCGECYAICQFHAIVYLPFARYNSIIEDLCHNCGACQVVCQHNAIVVKKKKLGVVNVMQAETGAPIIEGRTELGILSSVPLIKAVLKELNGEAITIIDAPPGISCPFIASVEKSDFVILVTEPTPFGLNDLKLTVQVLRLLGLPFGVVVNRAGIGNLEIYSWLADKKIPMLMEIPFENDIAKMCSEGLILAKERPEYEIKFRYLLEKMLMQPCAK